MPWIQKAELLNVCAGRACTDVTLWSTVKTCFQTADMDLESEEDLMHAMDTLQVLSGTMLQHEEVPGDGLCFFHCLVVLCEEQIAIVPEDMAWKMYFLALGLFLCNDELHYLTSPIAAEHAARRGRLAARQVTGIDELQTAEMYVVDKLLVLLDRVPVLDADHYADAPEITALVAALGWKILLVDMPYKGSGCILPLQQFVAGQQFEEACSECCSFDGVLLYWGGVHYEVVKVADMDLNSPRKNIEIFQHMWDQCKGQLVGLLERAGLSCMGTELGNVCFQAKQGDAGNIPADASPSFNVLDETASSDAASEELSSEESDCADYVDLVSVTKHKDWQTDQDAEDDVVENISTFLRDRPLVPSDPTDAESVRSWMDVDSGVRLPLVHCAFKGCSWTGESYRALGDHLCQNHSTLLAGKHHVCGMHEAGCEDVLAFYSAAIRKKEEMHMGLVGVSVDRRTIELMQQAMSSGHVRMLVCFCCACKKVELTGEGQQGDIRMHSAKALLELPRRTLTVNFGYDRFIGTYGTGPPFEHCEDLEARGSVRKFVKMQQ